MRSSHPPCQGKGMPLFIKTFGATHLAALPRWVNTTTSSLAFPRSRRIGFAGLLTYLLLVTPSQHINRLASVASRNEFSQESQQRDCWRIALLFPFNRLLTSHESFPYVENSSQSGLITKQSRCKGTYSSINLQRDANSCQGKGYFPNYIAPLCKTKVPHRTPTRCHLFSCLER